MVDIYTSRSRWKISKVVSVWAICRFFSLKTDENLCMDKFLVKMSAVSSTKKASSHLLPKLTAHDWIVNWKKEESTPNVHCTWMMDRCFARCAIYRDSIFNYCLQGERLFCYVQARIVIQYYHEIRCEFDRLAYDIN